MAAQYEGGFMPDDPRLARLQPIIQRYEINPQFAGRLAILAQCEIVILVDDSGSMNMPLQGTNQTRWDEMRQVNRLSLFHDRFLSIILFCFS